MTVIRRVLLREFLSVKREVVGVSQVIDFDTFPAVASQTENAISAGWAQWIERGHKRYHFVKICL